MSTYDERRTPAVANTFAEFATADFGAGAVVWVAGSLRRYDLTNDVDRVIGDVDLIVVPYDAADTMATLTVPEYAKATAKKAHGWMQVDGRRMMIDAWLCPQESLGPFGFFLTGPPALNVVMRQISQRAGLMLTQYGLFQPVPKPTKMYPDRMVPGERLDAPRDDDPTLVDAEQQFWSEWCDAVGLGVVKYPWPHEREGVMRWLQGRSRDTRSAATAPV